MPNVPDVMAHSAVVFMSAADADAYRAYGATFVGWGGANTPEAVRLHHDLGIACTGSMWCLTAGAELLHQDPALLAATSRDIAGNPVLIPWQFDKVYEGTRTFFGCTNSPAFRELCRQRVRTVMAGGADGLHVDDHCGVSSSAWYHGGGLCDHCIAAFRRYLADHASPEQLRHAGVADIAAFDYRHLVRHYATTREAYLQVQHDIPLMDHFLAFHADAAADHVRRLGELAAEVAGHPVLLSANTGLPDPVHLAVLPHLTHLICEVGQFAQSGTAQIDNAIAAYRLAEQYGKPMAASAGGHDWAFVKERHCEELVRFWIALAYAHGQRFMVPHPSRQWCFNETLGTHWYAAPVDAYAPLYRFIRAHRDCFDGFETARADDVRVPAAVHCTVRRHAAGRTVLHLLNTDYDPVAQAMRPQTDVRVSLPGAAAAARLLAYDRAPQTVPVRRRGERIEITVPRLHLWTLIALEPT